MKSCKMTSKVGKIAALIVLVIAIACTAMVMVNSIQKVTGHTVVQGPYTKYDNNGVIAYVPTELAQPPTQTIQTTTVVLGLVLIGEIVATVFVSRSIIAPSPPKKL